MPGDSGSTGYINIGDKETFSVSVKASSGCRGYELVTINAHCVVPRSVLCWYDDDLTDTATIRCAYCGDGICNDQESCSTCSQDCGSCCGNGKKDAGEDCKTCPQDAICSSNQACSNDGKCITLGTNENCASIGDRCAYNEECVNKVCKPKCGNGKKDSGENCANCPQDVVCGSNQACSTSGECVQLGTTQNCGGIGDSCGAGFCINNKCVECRTTPDCTAKKGTESTGKYECSSDRKGRYEIIVEKGGQCIDGKCSGSNEIKSNYLESCGSNPCYNGQCGCSEGYGKCEKTWTCERRGTILVGQPCDCDVQCESGFCKNGLCVKTIDVTLSSTKATLKPEEETTVTLSISSNLDTDIKGSATLKIGSGAEMIDINSIVGECSGNVCKISGTLAGRGNDEISIRIKSQSETTIPISADVSYKVEGQDVQIRKSTSIEFTEAKTTSITGMGMAQLTKNVPKNYLWGGIIVVIIIILLMFYFIGRKHRPQEKNKEENGPKKKEEIREKREDVNGSIAQEIERLHSLMGKGILTKKEFQIKKKDLLRK